MVQDMVVPHNHVWLRCNSSIAHSINQMTLQGVSVAAVVKKIRLVTNVAAGAAVKAWLQFEHHCQSAKHCYKAVLWEVQDVD
jgi:hypothetical protein